MRRCTRACVFQSHTEATGCVGIFSNGHKTRHHANILTSGDGRLEPLSVSTPDSTGWFILLNIRMTQVRGLVDPHLVNRLVLDVLCAGLVVGNSLVK